MDIELEGKLVCVFGLPNTGKTNFLRYITALPPYRRNLIFDPVKDYPTEKAGLVYRPKSREHSSEGGECDKELGLVVDEMVNNAPKALRPRYIIIDEANRSLKNQHPIPTPVKDLIDFNTHYDPRITVIAACRRPAKLHTDIREIANHFFIFSQGGKNDERSYSNIASDLPELLDEKDPYEFVHVNSNREATLFSPVKNMGEKGRI